MFLQNSIIYTFVSTIFLFQKYYHSYLSYTHAQCRNPKRSKKGHHFNEDECTDWQSLSLLFRIVQGIVTSIYHNIYKINRKRNSIPHVYMYNLLDQTPYESCHRSIKKSINIQSQTERCAGQRSVTTVLVYDLSFRSFVRIFYMGRLYKLWLMLFMNNYGCSLGQKTASALSQIDQIHIE